MSMEALQAAKAYGEAVKAQTNGDSAEAGGFAGLVKDAIANTSDTLSQAELMTNQAAMGQAELVDVVTAVAAAEVTLETVVSLRDKVVSAYQEIMRMPI